MKKISVKEKFSYVNYNSSLGLFFSGIFFGKISSSSIKIEIKC